MNLFQNKNNSICKVIQIYCMTCSYILCFIERVNNVYFEFLLRYKIPGLADSGM